MRRTQTAIALIVIGIAGFATAAPAQSIGELAKKTAAEREKAKADGKAAPTKTYTDKDLKAVASTPAAASDKAAADVGADKPKDGQPAATTDDKKTPDTPVKDETYWKNLMRTAQTQLTNHQTELVAAELQVSDVERFIRPDGTMSHTIADNLLAARRHVTDLLATIVNDKRAISDIEDDARKAGVPPGWLRWQ